MKTFCLGFHPSLPFFLFYLFLSFPGLIFPFFFFSSPPSLTVSVSDFLSLPSPLRPLHSLSASSPSVCCRGWANLLHAASLITSQDSHIWDGLQRFQTGQQTPTHTHLDTLRHTNANWTAGSSSASRSGF